MTATAGENSSGPIRGFVDGFPRPLGRGARPSRFDLDNDRRVRSCDVGRASGRGRGPRCVARRIRRVPCRVPRGLRDRGRRVRPRRGRIVLHLSQAVARRRIAGERSASCGFLGAFRRGLSGALRLRQVIDPARSGDFRAGGCGAHAGGADTVRGRVSARAWRAGTRRCGAVGSNPARSSGAVPRPSRSADADSTRGGPGRASGSACARPASRTAVTGGRGTTDPAPPAPGPAALPVPPTPPHR